MLIIENREEVKNFLLKKTADLNLSKQLFEILETPPNLCNIYNIPRDIICCYNSYSELKKQFEDYKYYNDRDFNNINSSSYSFNNNFSILDLHESVSFIDINTIAAIITIVDFSYRIWKENKNSVNTDIKKIANDKKNNNSKSKIKNLFFNAIKMIKIENTNNENTIISNEENNKC